jgi:alkylhydroperoxidase family enzyme
MAEAPGLVEAYLALNKLFLETSFSAEEKTVVWQALNVEHDCAYCVPAHTGIAKQMKVADEITEALRNETPLPTSRLEALRSFTLAALRKRGAVSEADEAAFLAEGFTRRQVLEVVLGISMKVVSNYTNKIVDAPVDPHFQKFAWSKSAAAA